MMLRQEYGYKKLTIDYISKAYGLSRQAYYKSMKENRKKQLDKEKVLMLVKDRRAILPREGCRKLYKALEQDFKAEGLSFGRDKLFDILREYDLLVEPRKKFTSTTNSNHPFRIYKNLILDFIPTGANQLYVSDITYIRTKEGFCYLCLITDAYSRKIVGYDISDSLELEGCQRALEMALKALPKDHSLVHHSDRGVQYCSNEYTKLLKEHDIKISMADRGNCYQNALAERVNGILKDEFYLDINFVSKHLAIKSCIQAIMLYNNKRLHLSLDYRIPSEVHAA